MIRYLDSVVLSFPPRTAIMILGSIKTVRCLLKVLGGMWIATTQISTVFITMAVTLHLQMVSTGTPGKDITIPLEKLK